MNYKLKTENATNVGVCNGIKKINFLLVQRSMSAKTDLTFDEQIEVISFLVCPWKRLNIWNEMGFLLGEI